jgi:HPt (histidine-containing phosphotransfer) domain-containing protein
MDSYKHVNIDQLNEMTEGSNELIHDLIYMFMKQVPIFSEQLDTLYHKGEYLELGKLAHKIKGSVSTMGIADLANNMKELETLAKGSQHAEKYPELINKYKTISAEAIEELKDIINRIKQK